jgi:hypothetical protein
MRFWIREIAGWALVGLGLYFFLVCFAMLMVNPLTIPMYLEAGFPAFMGFIVFRGGIHLLKVAVAARICLHAEKIQAARDRQPSKT